MTLNLAAKNKCFSSLILCVFFTIVSFKAQSYVKFNSAPVEGWGAIFEQSGVKRYYEVQHLDNLYDISETLFGQSSFWPKIWSINSGITNPHLIEKGRVIYFSGGSQVEPPRFGVDKIVPNSYVYGSGFIQPELPPERLQKRAIEIPEAFQNYFTTVDQEKKEKKVLESISKGEVIAESVVRKISITSELTSSKPDSVGEIVRLQTSGSVAKTGTMVLIKVKRGQVPEIGQVLTAFNYEKKTFVGVKAKMSTGFVEWLGKIRVTGESKNGHYFAEIIECNEFLPIGAKLSTKPMYSVEIPNETPSDISEVIGDSSVQIIGANKTSRSTVIGDYSIVYIKGGQRKGLVQDQIYPVYDNFGVGGVHKKKSYKPKNVGYVKIAKVSKGFATGVLFNLSDNVTSGSVLGQVE